LRQLAANSIFTLFILFPYVCQSGKCNKSLIAVVLLFCCLLFESFCLIPKTTKQTFSNKLFQTNFFKQNNAIFDKKGQNIEIETFND